MPKSDFAPQGPKPHYSVLYKMVRNPQVEAVQLWNIVPLGGPRWVTTATGRRKGQKSMWFRLLVVARQGTQWKKIRDLEIEHPGDSTLPGGGKVGSTVQVRDFDHDGRPEAQVRYRYPTGATGKGEMRKLALVDLGGAPRLQAGAILAEMDEHSGLKESAYLRYRDRNGDHWPDLVVSRVARVPGTPKPQKVDEVFLYEPKSDGYKRQTPETTTLPPGVRIGLGRISIECLNLGCLDVRGLPAITVDGRLLAVLSDYPMMETWSAALGDWLNLGVRFDLVEVATAKILKTVDFINSEHQSAADQGTREDCCADIGPNEPCDPRLCPQDKRMFSDALTGILQDLQTRRVAIAKALATRRLTPLTALAVVTKEAKPPAKGLAALVKETKSGTFEARLASYPGAEVLAQKTFALGKTYVDKETTRAWLDRGRRLVILRTLGTSNPYSDVAVRYAIWALPATVKLP